MHFPGILSLDKIGFMRETRFVSSQSKESLWPLHKIFKEKEKCMSLRSLHTRHKLRGRSVLALVAVSCITVLSLIPIAVSYAHSTGSTQYPNFKGIYEFSGYNSSTDASNPALAGRSLVYYWAQLEPKKGQYNWSLIDQDMQPWIDNGKNIILRVSPAGWKNWDTAADSGHGTRQWVYDLRVPSVTEADGAVLPQYGNTTFLQNYSDFIQAFANRYDNNPHVTAIEMGIGDGTKVDTYNKGSTSIFRCATCRKQGPQ
jgi:Beta-galactosidase